jgi:hypothetical protein
MKKSYEQQGVAMTCRSFMEYERMFMLEPQVLRKGPILDVAAGASGFTAESNARGYQARAVDPLYSLSASDIAERGKREIEEATRKLADVPHLYVSDFYGSMDNHRAIREISLARFVKDYQSFKDKGRYVEALLPDLPFPDDSFSLILCSHFLFLYEAQFDFDFHYRALKELIRICDKDGEVRVYPLVGFDGEPYREMDRLIDVLEQDGIRADFLETGFRFLSQATKVLRLQK